MLQGRVLVFWLVVLLGVAERLRASPPRHNNSVANGKSVELGRL
jgi:hypothetical protein